MQTPDFTKDLLLAEIIKKGSEHSTFVIDKRKRQGMKTGPTFILGFGLSRLSGCIKLDPTTDSFSIHFINEDKMTNLKHQIEFGTEFKIHQELYEYFINRLTEGCADYNIDTSKIKKSTSNYLSSILSEDKKEKYTKEGVNVLSLVELSIIDYQKQLVMMESL